MRPDRDATAGAPLREDVASPGAGLLAGVLDALPHAVLAVDAEWRVLVANARARALLDGGTPDGGTEVVGGTLWALVPGLADGPVGAGCRLAHAGREPRVVEGAIRGRAGRFQVHAVPAGDGGLVIHLREVTAARGAPSGAGAPREPAAGDLLTGLANRQSFVARLGDAVDRVRAHPPAADAPRPAVLLFDVDGLSGVNATHGHEAGDLLLHRVASRLAREARGDDLVARVGADEFAVLLGAVEPDGEVAVGERLLAALAASDGAERGADGLEGSGAVPEGVRLTASLGTVVVDGSADAGAVLRHAGAALARARAAGRGRLSRSTPELRAELQARDDVAAALGASVRELIDAPEGDTHGFSLVYQPVVELATGVPAGAEALVRWRHGALGEVSPGTFIPLAEELGLIAPLGSWVLRTACAAMHGLGRSIHEAAGLSVSVNVSGHQLAVGELADEIAAALAGSGLPPTRLTVELTETALVRDPRRARRVLGELRVRGVRVALDDFGAGYASLGYLHELPIDLIKIDRSFVARMGGGRGPSAAIPRAMVALGQALGLRTVGEGVETAEQRDALAAIGCTYGQGYLFSRPLALPELVAWLRESPRPGAT